MDNFTRSRDLYQTGNLDVALVAIRELCARDPDNAEAWWLLGCVTRHLGLISVSDDGFRRAALLLPKQMPIPHRVTPEHFRTLLAEARRILAESGGSTARGPEMTAQELQALRETSQEVVQHSASARRWGITVPGGAAAAHVETTIRYLPSRDAIHRGLSPDAQWSREGDTGVLYQANHENAAGSDRDLVHCLVRNLVSASKAPPGMYAEST